MTLVFNIRPLHSLLGLSLMLTLAQCSQSGETDVIAEQAAIDQTLIETYIAANDTTVVAHESGIYYTIVDTVATGAPAAGGILSIYYTAKILEGSAFDIISRADNDDSVKLKQGVGAVYPIGLDIGLGLMKVGETFRFYIPSTLGFGGYAFSSLIPANSILEIEVEVAASQNESDILTEQLDLIDAYIIDQELNDTLANPIDSVEFLIAEQIYYKRMTEGTEDDTLRRNDTATISYIGTTLDGSEIDRRTTAQPLTYTFGVNAIISGLDDGVSAMERSETALIILPSHKAYGESAFIIPSYRKQDFVDLEIVPQYAAKVAPYEIVIFETSLLNNP